VRGFDANATEQEFVRSRVANIEFDIALAVLDDSREFDEIGASMPGAVLRVRLVALRPLRELVEAFLLKQDAKRWDRLARSPCRPPC
jgi:hypothetical protein